VKSLRSRKTPILSPAARTRQGIFPVRPVLLPVYCKGTVPPSPLVSWNHGVRRKSSGWSLNLKDLRVRSLITNDLASISHLVVKLARPIDTLGHENGRFQSDHSVVIKDRPRLREPS
jgi:hypothetical protein